MTEKRLSLSPATYAIPRSADRGGVIHTDEQELTYLRDGDSPEVRFGRARLAIGRLPYGRVFNRRPAGMKRDSPDQRFDRLDAELTLVTRRLVGVRAIELGLVEGSEVPSGEVLAQIWQGSASAGQCASGGQLLMSTSMYAETIDEGQLVAHAEAALGEGWSIGDALAAERLVLVGQLGYEAAVRLPSDMSGSLRPAEGRYAEWIDHQINELDESIPGASSAIRSLDMHLTTLYLHLKVAQDPVGLTRLIKRLDELRPAEDSSELPGGGRYISTSVSGDLVALRRKADDEHPIARRAQARMTRTTRRSGNPAKRNGSSHPSPAPAAKPQPRERVASVPAATIPRQQIIEVQATIIADHDDTRDQQPFLGHSANQLRRLGVLGGRDSLGYRLQQFHESDALDSDGLDIGRIIRVYTSLRALVIDTNGSTELAERRATWQQEVETSTDSVDKELAWLGDHWPHVVAAIDRSKHKMHVTNEQLAALAEVLGVLEEDLAVSLDNIPPTSSRRSRKRVRPAPVQHEEPQHESNGDTPAQQEYVVRLRSGGDLGDYLEKLCKNQSNHLRPTLERVIEVLAKRVSSENGSRAGIKKMRAIRLASGPCARELPLFEFKPSEAQLGSEINTSVVRRWRILYTVERDANDRLVIGIHEVVHRNMLDDQARRVYQGV